MNKYLIVYDAGYGEMAEIEDCDNHDVAVHLAYELWKEAAESSAEYRAELLTPKLAKEYGLEYPSN